MAPRGGRLLPPLKLGLKPGQFGLGEEDGDGFEGGHNGFEVDLAVGL